MFARLPIVRLIREHRDERAIAEQERRRLRSEQYELSRRATVLGWMADTQAEKRRESNGHGG